MGLPILMIAQWSYCLIFSVMVGYYEVGLVGRGSLTVSESTQGFPPAGSKLGPRDSSQHPTFCWCRRIVFDERLG
jgi:hypothetical protein